jgi:hypothetical protein
MIELKRDELCFNFPDIRDQLRRLVDGHVDQALPGILAEDRTGVTQLFLKSQYRYQNTPASYKSKALDAIARVTDEAIREALAKEADDRASYEVRGAGTVRVSFQRTLRIPDDGRDYPLPPGLGCFPLRHVDDFARNVSEAWLQRGGVMMPMYQAEALWLNFSASYPMALKVASGKVSAITGAPWQEGLGTEPQDYLVLPQQPWLDGYAVAKGIIRQFVAMPLGAGYSVEEQLSGRAEFGGLQLQAFPLKAAVHFERDVRPRLPKVLADLLPRLLPELPERDYDRICFSMDAPSSVRECCDMGLGAGGRMRQEIYADPHDPADWDLSQSSRCFVHLCDALLWREITGEPPPHTPVTTREYERAGLPWFDYYRDDVAVLEGSKKLAGAKSVVELSAAKGDKAITGDSSVSTGDLVSCGPKRRPGVVREWTPA